MVGIIGDERLYDAFCNGIVSADDGVRNVAVCDEVHHLLMRQVVVPAGRIECMRNTNRCRSDDFLNSLFNEFNVVIFLGAEYAEPFCSGDITKRAFCHEFPDVLAVYGDVHVDICVAYKAVVGNDGNILAADFLNCFGERVRFFRQHDNYVYFSVCKVEQLSVLLFNAVAGVLHDDFRTKIFCRVHEYVKVTLPPFKRKRID